ncbi:hypothetical protein JCM11641_004769 [Rhodosporidiobolus odoratus]
MAVAHIVPRRGVAYFYDYDEYFKAPVQSLARDLFPHSSVEQNIWTARVRSQIPKDLWNSWSPEGQEHIKLWLEMYQQLGVRVSPDNLCARPDNLLQAGDPYDLIVRKEVDIVNYLASKWAAYSPEQQELAIQVITHHVQSLAHQRETNVELGRLVDEIVSLAP